ncbi:MAG: hypothetical protein ACW99J_19185 [Candidatus Thorarchaeota archaeon]
MAGVYSADIFCDDCIEYIKDDICQQLWDSRNKASCPNGTPVIDFSSCAALNRYLRGMDEQYYCSGNYPKYSDDDEESDCPQHCGAGDDCLNAIEMSDGHKIGYFFGNSLTTEGIDYVKEAVREGGTVAVEVWKPLYDDIDYDEF